MTTTIIKSSSKKKIALPAFLIKSFDLEEDQPVEVKKWGAGFIVTPVDFKFNKERARKATAKAENNIRKGNVLEFDSTKEAIEYLES